MKEETVSEKKLPTEQEFQALCALIADEHGRTLTALTREFKSLLRRAPEWKDWLAAHPETAAAPKLAQMIEENHWEATEEYFHKQMWRGTQSVDLEQGLALLSAFADPLLNTQRQVSGVLDQMASELQPALAQAVNEDQLIRAFKDCLFIRHGFHGNVHHYYDPSNSYLHKVLETKSGIPISLSSVCLLLGQRLSWRGKPLPLAGVGLPSHFIVQFRFPGKVIFMDPFSRGRILLRDDCKELLERQDISFQDSYLWPVNSHAVLCRSITNLLHIYTNMGDERKKSQLIRYLQVLNAEADAPAVG